MTILVHSDLWVLDLSVGHSPQGEAPWPEPSPFLCYHRGDFDPSFASPTRLLLEKSLLLLLW